MEEKSILANGVLVSLFLALVLGHAQEAAKLTLRLEQTIPVRAVTGGFSLPLKCDREGNVYIRSASNFREPVLKVSPDGQKLADFSLASVPDWEKGEFYDFVIRPDGEVYLLAARRGQGGKIESAILQFNEQGRFRFVTDLDFDPFYVNQLEVFSTGEFLISGWKREPPTRNGQAGNKPAQEEELVEPLLAVVNPAGEMVHRLRFAPADEEATSETPETLPRSAISLAATATGDDGFLYLMLREGKARIFVISPVSGVVKSLEVTPPVENLSPMSPPIYPRRRPAHPIRGASRRKTIRSPEWSPLPRPSANGRAARGLSVEPRVGWDPWLPHLPWLFVRTGEPSAPSCFPSRSAQIKPAAYH